MASRPEPPSRQEVGGGRSRASRGAAQGRVGRTASVRSGTERQTGDRHSRTVPCRTPTAGGGGAAKAAGQGAGGERSRFFNRPGAGADFVRWSKAAYWTIDEGVALLLGKAPEVVNWESVRDSADVSPFARRYAELRDLALRSQDSGQLTRRSVPALFSNGRSAMTLISRRAGRAGTASTGRRNAHHNFQGRAV